jgi:hypothetical protein
VKEGPIIKLRERAIRHALVTTKAAEGFFSIG